MANSKVIKRNANVVNLNRGITEETLFFTGNEESTDFVMGIPEDNVNAILNELTDLSSNPGAYAIREAYSNAYDAVAATGDMSRPIEVTVPKSDEFNDESLTYKLRISECPMSLIRYATVTDYGIGMTTDDLRRFFTQYGGTKKQGAGLIGSKGLGSKAPLACADFFDVATVHDGILSMAHLWRGSGYNYAKIVKVEPTDKPDGTTVRIPIVDPKIAIEMDKCMSSIAKWNLDANLTYNGEKASGSLDMGLTKDGTSGYVFLGNVAIGVDENGDEVRVRMWQDIASFPRRLHLYKDNYNNGTINCDLSVDLNLCGVRYSLAKGNGYHARHNGNKPNIIVAGDPGYLNFTPSRDEVKDDDAKRTFLEAISEVEYDMDATFKSLFENNDYATVTRSLINCQGFIHRNDKETTLYINDRKVGAISDDSALTVFDGIDMSEYLINNIEEQGYVPKFAHVNPKSPNRYIPITKLTQRGYNVVTASYDEEGAFIPETITWQSQSYTAHDIAFAMRDASPLPLAAIIPSVAMHAQWNDINDAILNEGINHALVITGKLPAWKQFQSRESAIRRLVASKNGQDMTIMSLTYLFLDGENEPDEQDKLALSIFTGVTITTWDELMSDVRAMNRSTSSGSNAKKGGNHATGRILQAGTAKTTVYDLRNRRNYTGDMTPFEHPVDALMGTMSYREIQTIDFNNDDLSKYVFAIGDAGNPNIIARIASALAMAGRLGNAEKLAFVSTTSSCSKTYPLDIPMIKVLVKTRDMKVFGDFRYNRAHFNGIIDGIPGMSYKVCNNGHGYYYIQSDIRIDSLGDFAPSYENLAFALRYDSKFNWLNTFIINCRAILGTTFCKTLDLILDAKTGSWWCDGEFNGGYRSNRAIGLQFPKSWEDALAPVKDALEVFEDISEVRGTTSVVAHAASDPKSIATSLVSPGLKTILQARIAQQVVGDPQDPDSDKSGETK